MLAWQPEMPSSQGIDNPATVGAASLRRTIADPVGPLRVLVRLPGGRAYGLPATMARSTAPRAARLHSIRIPS